MRFSWSAPRLRLEMPVQIQKVGPQFGGGLIPLEWDCCAGLENDCIQTHELHGDSFIRGARQFRKPMNVESGCCHVKHLAHAVNIGCGRARPFRREVSFGSDVGHALSMDADVRDQTDVGKLRNAFDEDDVRGLDITVNETVLV